VTNTKYDPTFGQEKNVNDGNAITAFWIAGIRAQEFQRGEKARVKDPYAELLMKDDGWKNFKPLFRLRNAIVNRTIFHDNNVMMGARDFGIRQTIIIGAGLDTRAFRLFQDYPDMHVIEVDHPKLFDYKESRLKDTKPSCKRSILPLTYDEVANWDVHAQKKVGYDPSKPTIFILEGVTMYIPLENEMELYRKIDSNGALNSIITGCSQKVRGANPRDLGNGIVWHDTDRIQQIKIMEKWGLNFKSYHGFVNIGTCMMFKGVKRSTAYCTQGNLVMSLVMSQLLSPPGLFCIGIAGVLSSYAFSS